MLFHIHKHHTQKNKHTNFFLYIWLGTQKCNANVIPTWKRLHWKLNLAPYNELPVLGELPSKFTTSENLQIWTFWGHKIVLCKEPCKNKSINLQSALETSQVTYVTMVPRVGNETLRPLGVATGNALSVTRSEDTYEKTPPVGRRQPMTSLPAYHNISAAGRIHHQLLRLKLASEAWLKAQGTQCLVPHSGNHGYIRNLRRSPSWELELRPLGVATGNVIPTSPCWGECKPISQKRRALSQLYPA